jgi:hypothetical protein
MLLRVVIDPDPNDLLTVLRLSKIPPSLCHPSLLKLIYSLVDHVFVLLAVTSQILILHDWLNKKLDYGKVRRSHFLHAYLRKQLW